MARLTVAVPAPPRVQATPEKIEKLWDEAYKASRKDAAALRERRKRARRARA